MSTTFDQYVLNFRADLQSAAKDCLSSLGLQIKNEGDDWLEAHLDSLFSGGVTGGAIVEHLKTPSRTATAKKTRAKLEAEKQRTDKVKSVNAKLALSPSSTSINASPARLLFQQNNSPLQPRSMNAVSPSPIKAKPDQSIKKQGPARKPSRSAKGDENAGSNPSQRVTQVRSPQRQPTTVTSPVTRATARQAALSPAQSPSRPTKSPLRQATSPTPRSPAPKQARSRPQSPTPIHKSASATPAAAASTVSKKTIPAAHKDLSMIMEGDSERTSSKAKSPVRQTVRSPPAKRPQSPRSVPQQVASPQSPARRPVAHQPSIDSILAPSAHVTSSGPAAPAASTTPAQPAVPVRAVRSSWLSKAIASGAVPVNPASDVSRKSVVPQSRPTLPTDYAGLRKSLAAPAGLKRKSEDGPNEEEDEPVRPVKAVKVDAPATQPPSKPVFERQQSNPSAPVAAAPAVVAHPTPAPAPVSKEVQTPSEILKVTKALEDIKERTQAKELAKQKAAAAAAAAANGQRARENTQSGPSGSTTSGFLRGLTKSLGLGGKTESPEEIAERLHRELEDDRRAEAEAQAELDRLMHGDKREDEVDNKKQSTLVPAQVERSTTPVASPPPQTKEQAHPDSDRTEEEEEEDEVVEALSLVEDEEPVVQTSTSASAESKRDPKPTAVAHSHGQPVPPRLATPPRMSDFRMSTTPNGTPPRRVQQQQAPPLHDRAEKHDRSSPAKQPKVAPAPRTEQADAESDGTDTADEEDEDIEIEDDEGRESVAASTEGTVTQHVQRVPHIKQAMASTRPTLPTSASTTSLVPLAPSSQGLLNQAPTIAAKTLGVKPTTAPVKSVQLAQAAAKKEQDAAARKQTFREQAEARRQEANRKKAEEEHARAVEAERIRQQEIERGQKLRAELDRKKAEREEKMAMAMKQQAERQQKEAAAAKAKAAEEEANRKRKMAPTLNKSTNANPAKRVPPTTGVNGSTAQQKARETFRPTSSMKGTIASSTTVSATASTAVSGTAKLGPTSFRTAPPPPDPSQSTIRLVNATPAHLGPPSRPSGMAATSHTHPHPQWSHIPTNGGAGPSNILQQQRVALQSQLDDKALEAQAEDIVLPDIASEYSDSNDSEKSNDFKRPEWAESPELRAALERQSTRNPDELFGPIKPISMEELFKVKVNKFRPRSSSANWASGDGVTRKEEIEYARRMGFKNSNPRAEGSSTGGGLGQ